jgi:hypothetical protein
MGGAHRHQLQIAAPSDQSLLPHRVSGRASGLDDQPSDDDQVAFPAWWYWCQCHPCPDFVRSDNRAIVIFIEGAQEHIVLLRGALETWNTLRCSVDFQTERIDDGRPESDIGCKRLPELFRV